MAKRVNVKTDADGPASQISGRRPPKRIVILCDGTGNSAAKPFKTNVWRLYQALDMEGGDQIAAFSDGVGTSSFRPLAIIGLALGFGVKSRVIDLYKFLSLNYREGDDIYVFGFSRGAFITRVLVGLVYREGLADPTTSEQLDIDARAAYRSYRRRAFKVGKWQFWVHGSRALIDLYQAAMRSTTGQGRTLSDPTVNAGADIPIRFLGVWDTVAAYGLPIEELTDAVDRWVWPLTFASNDLLGSVQCARQAFAIDDERRTFFPIPFNESEELTSGDNPRLRQVWFAGAHANVGGSYPDDRLAMLPLTWMIAEAAKCGLRFDAETVADYWDDGSLNGRIYDPRAGVSLFYRYQPRPVQKLMRPKLNREVLNVQITPLVNSSVIRRIARGSDGYAPIDLPTDLKVLSPIGRVDSYSVAEKRGSPAPELPPSIIDPLPQPADRMRNLVQAEADLHGSMERLRGQTAKNVNDQQEAVRDLIWWRQVVYLTILGLALLFAFFPLIAGYVTNTSIDSTGQAIIGPVIGVIRGFVPRFLDPWLDAAIVHASAAVSLGIGLCVALWLNQRLATRIRDGARATWDVNFAIRKAALDKSRHGSALRSVLNGGIGFGILALVTWLTRNNFTEPFAVASALFFGAYGLMRVAPEGGHGGAILCKIARAWRNDAWAGKFHRFVTRQLGPVAFLSMALLLALIAVNKISFEVANAAGAICPPADGTTEDLTVEGAFSTDALCWSSGAALQAGVTYLVKVEVTGSWRDGPVATDVLGFQAGDTNSPFVFYVGNVLKRWWGQPYFKPIARVGHRGNEEYPLDQVQPDDLSKKNVTELIARIKPASTGPLYLYVNDSALALPGLTDLFYRQSGPGPNGGTAKVSVMQEPIPEFHQNAPDPN